MAFRTRVFEFCNILEKDDLRLSVKQTMKALKMSDEKSSMKMTISSLVGNQKAQFLGYLLIDDDVDEIRAKEVIFNSLEHLSIEQRSVIEVAHQLCLCFIDCCLSDLKTKYPRIAKILNPYAYYLDLKKFSKVPQDCPIDIDIIRKHTNSFKMTPLYQKIGSSTDWDVITKLPEDKLYQLIGAIKRDIYDVGFGEVPDFLKEYSLKKRQQSKEPIQILTEQAITLLCLREMLETAVQMVFITLCGGNLVVLNNDNIISIDKQFSNGLYEGISILTIDISGMFLSEIGGLALVNCTQNGGHELKKFGRIDGLTFSMNQEEGETMRYRMRVVDDYLNPFFNIFS